MQKKVSAAVRAFGRAHKAGLALLGGGVAALGVFWAARRSAAAMQWWVEYVSMPVKRFVSALVEPLPFSFCELAATAAILICLVRLVQRIVRAMHRKQAGFAAWVLHVGHRGGVDLCRGVRFVGHPVLCTQLCRAGQHAGPGPEHGTAGRHHRVVWRAGERRR